MKFTRLLPSIVALAAAMTLFFAPAAAPAQADPQANPFAGDWSGTISVAEFGVVVRVGTYDWTISRTGRIQGTIHITTAPGSSGAVVGRVGSDGRFTVANFAPDDVPSNGHNGLPYQGTAVIDDDKLVASATRLDVAHTFVAILERN